MRLCVNSSESIKRYKTSGLQNSLLSLNTCQQWTWGYANDLVQAPKSPPVASWNEIILQACYEDCLSKHYSENKAARQGLFCFAGVNVPTCGLVSPFFLLFLPSPPLFLSKCCPWSCNTQMVWLICKLSPQEIHFNTQPLASLPPGTGSMARRLTATKQESGRSKGNFEVEWTFSPTRIKIKVTEIIEHNITRYC